MTKINFVQRWKVIEEIKKGFSQRQIAHNLCVSRRSVQEIAKKHAKTGNVDDLRRCGRPSKTTIRENRNLTILSKKYPSSSAADLRREWKTNSSISISTVKRILAKYGLHGRIAAKKPFLNLKHIRNRFMWSLLYNNWTMDQWSQVIFSDETKIELFSKRRKYIRRLDKTRFHQNNLLKTVKFGGKSLMCWGAIKADGSRTLIRCQNTLNSENYQNVLVEGLLPIYNSSNILIQDGAPCHRSRSTIEFLGKNSICYIDDWPAQSPDINIIENLWSIIKRNVCRKPAKTLDELWKYFQEEWYSIPDETIKSLYQSIPRRLTAIRKCRGGCTKY